VMAGGTTSIAMSAVLFTAWAASLKLVAGA
jgi:hypothetical protein